MIERTATPECAYRSAWTPCLMTSCGTRTSIETVEPTRLLRRTFRFGRLFSGSMRWNCSRAYSSATNCIAPAGSASTNCGMTPFKNTDIDMADAAPLRIFACSRVRTTSTGCSAVCAKHRDSAPASSLSLKPSWTSFHPTFPFRTSASEAAIAYSVPSSLCQRRRPNLRSALHRSGSAFSCARPSALRRPRALCAQHLCDACDLNSLKWCRRVNFRMNLSESRRTLSAVTCSFIGCA
mmetsp:Transcript_1339/g.3672  ORF Transcript_1339/g.3672 Transcript_1339/m.3672 type:complete len:237 (-) Transcript_1339:375-1085(-)